MSLLIFLVVLLLSFVFIMTMLALSQQNLAKKNKAKDGGLRISDAGVRDLVAQGQIDEAIELYRRFTGVDLFTAKRAVADMVVGLRLGCLNHALLTVSAIRQQGLTLAGWVINRVDPHMSRYEENLDTLKAMLPAPFLGELPFVDAVNEVDLHHCLDVSPLL